MTRKIRKSRRFLKDYEKARKQKKDIKRLKEIISLLANRQKLPQSCKEHYLIGDYKGSLECHISNDWLLIYKVFPKEDLLILERLGTHNELFNY